MKTETVYFKSGEFGNFAVHIDGLSSLMRHLKESDPKLRKATAEGLKEAAQPVLTKARANASRIADDGTYRQSLAITTRRNGANIVLKSTDPAAPVKEFARLGAKTITSKGTPLANARLRKRSGVGVPRRAYAPRVMVPAVNDSTDEVMLRIQRRLARVLEGFNG